MTGSPSNSSTTPEAGQPAPGGRTALIVVSWLWVGLPLVYGLYELVLKVKQLFTG